jgi:DNA-binding transcriptional regulator GbsR (MarR family)
MLPKDNLTEEFANRWGWEKSFGQRLGCFSLADKLSLDDFMNPAIPVRKTI